MRKPDGSSAYEWVSVLDDRYAQDYLLIKALGTWTANFSGPVPFLSPLTFFVTGRLIQDNGYLPFGYNILRSATAKLTYPVSSVFTLRGSGDWSTGYRQFYDHQYKYWRWWDSGLDTLGREGGFPINETRSNRQLLSARHVLSQSTFYDLSLARVYEYSNSVVPDRTVVADPATGELDLLGLRPSTVGGGERFGLSLRRRALLDQHEDHAVHREGEHRESGSPQPPAARRRGDEVPRNLPAPDRDAHTSQS